jgi:C1A family cysteine protease
VALVERSSKGLGWRPDIPDYRDLNFDDAPFRAARAETAKPELKLPASYIIPRAKLPPVFDQGQLGSCVGNSVSTVMSMVRKVKPRSRLFIYYEARRLINETDRDEGCYIRDAVKVVANLGAPREDIWPYYVGNVFVDPPLNIDRSAKTAKIFKYARLNTREDFRKCLAEGYPFVIGFSVYDGFTNGKGISTEIQLLPEPGQVLTGGHAVAVIGYDSNFRESQWAKDNIARGFPIEKIPNDVYIVRNSWGIGWGRNGDFAIDAHYLENRNLADDAWTMRNS